MKKWQKLFTLKNGQLYWKQAAGNRKAGSQAGTAHGDGYKTVRIDGKAHYVHRIVKEMSSGKPLKKEVDHKDRNRANNKPSNLRVATRSLNTKNRKSWKRSK